MSLSLFRNAGFGLIMGLVAHVKSQDPVTTGVQSFVMDDARLNESSGLALGLRNPGVLWSLNDSGGGAFLFAVNETGVVLGRYSVKGAFNFDWEDMASGADSIGTPVLYVADIGDNFEIRSDVQIYAVEEPKLDASHQKSGEQEVEVKAIYRASYPDGMHNAESLLCHPLTGRLFIITKKPSGECGVYAFPEKLNSGGILTLERVADIHLTEITRKGKRPIDNRLSTAACFSPDGNKLVLMTYSSLYEWDLPKSVPLRDALAKKPLRIETPFMNQAEAVCYSQEGTHFWCTSERLPAPLHRISRETK